MVVPGIRFSEYSKCVGLETGLEYQQFPHPFLEISEVSLHQVHDGSETVCHDNVIIITL